MYNKICKLIIMCDTLYKSFANGQSVFAKNSDRDPLEPQVTEIAAPSLVIDQPYINPLRKQYAQENIPTLQKAFFDLSPSYQAIISRPTWIWGAEMGVNEKGVAIGNEAVFSFARLEKNGLLGMDILRLALHGAANALEAVEIITYLLQNFGQGGNGAFRGKLTYHNSFLIADTTSAYVVETAGKNYAVKHVRDFYSISNVYTLQKDYGLSNAGRRINFRRHYQASIYNLFTRGPVRRKFTMQQLDILQEPFAIRSIMRSHIKSQEPKPSMASICMHSPRMIKSQTTASMIVQYSEQQMLIWTTLSPLPCLSLYKPLTFTFARENALLRAPKNLDFFTQRYRATKKLLADGSLKEKFLQWQKDFEDSCYQQLNDFQQKTQEQLSSIIAECWDREQDIINSIITN